MASINTLPVELLYKIVDLTVEDAIALRGGGGGRDDHELEKLRRKILIRIALVSKDFTQPAQLALWRYMITNDVRKVGDLIEAGFGKDKVIEELRICISLLPDDENDIFNSFLSFLRGVKRVISITNMTIYGFNLRFDDFFEIDSIQGLLVSPEARLPSQLRHLTIFSLSTGVDNMISRLIESSVSSLRSIKLMGIESSQYSGSTLSSALASLGPKLQKLDITDCDDSILSSLLPHCTCLKSLSIHLYNWSSREPLFETLIDTLYLIPKSVILGSFATTFPDIPNLDHVSALIRLLQTAPFSQLKKT